MLKTYVEKKVDAKLKSSEQEEAKNALFLYISLTTMEFDIN